MICGGANWRVMLRPAFSGAPRGFARGLEGLTNSSYYLFAALHGYGQASSRAGTHPVQSPNLSCRETTPRRGQSGRKNISLAPHLEHLKRRLSPCKEASPKRSSRGATATIRWWLHFSHQTHKSSLRTASHDRRAGSGASLSSSFFRSSPNTQHKLSEAVI